MCLATRSNSSPHKVVSKVSFQEATRVSSQEVLNQHIPHFNLRKQCTVVFHHP